MSDGIFQKNTTSKKSAYILGGAVGVLSTLVSMLFFAAIILFLNIDRAYAAPFASISIAFGCFIASKITAKKIGDKGYLIGLIVGTVVFIILTLLSLILGGKLSINTLFHFVIILLSSLSGGIVGVNSNKSKKYI